jgi:hypothetical protein
MAAAANVLSLNFAVVSACAAVVTDFCRLQLLMVANLSLVMWIELAGYPSAELAGWLTFRKSELFGQDQFPLAGVTQDVNLVQMFDQQFAARAEQIGARYPALRWMA